MDVHDFYALRDDLLKEALQVTKAKGDDYTTGDSDALKNFKSVARDLGLTKYQILGVYAKKHFDAIMAYCKTGGQNESEPIKGRIIDSINYALLLYGMVKEDEMELVNSQTTAEVKITPTTNPNTVEDFLRLIKDPAVREQALKAYNDFPRNRKSKYKPFSVKDAINNGFDWSSTLEGDDYWLNVYENTNY